MPREIQGDRPGASREVVELRHDDHGRVCVIPQDNDLMMLSIQEAALACRAYTDQIRFNHQFHLLADRLCAWMAEFDAKVSEGYLTVRDTGLLFLVVSRSEKFDLELEDSLTDLDIEVAADPDFGLINLSVHSIPGGTCQASDTTSAFVSDKMAIKFVRNAQ